MAPGGALSDPDDIKWTWLGPGTKKGTYTYYTRAQVVRISDSAKRIFETGDTVYVANDEGQPWVAQIVEMFQVGGHLNDDECQVVEDAASALMRMRCTLRWFYNADDESITASKRISPRIPTSIRGEIYFSDHVENGTSNSLEVIEGRAFLCASDVEMNLFHSSQPANYWEGDAVRLVRCFYGYNAGKPPPIRELGKGELELLIKNPSKDPDLYNRTRLTLYGPHGAVMKGTGAKKRLKHKASVSPKQTPLSTKEGGSHGRSYHQFSPFSNTNEASSRRYKYEERPMRSRIVFDSSDDDSASSNLQEHQPPPSQFKPVRPARKTSVERKAKKKHRSKVNKIASSSTEIRPQTAQSQNVLKSTQIELRILGNTRNPENQQGIKRVSSAAAQDLEGAWAKVHESLKTGTRGQQEHAFQKLPEMLDLFIKLMKQNDLSFDMDETNKNSISKIVAKQIFGHLPGSGSADVSASNSCGGQVKRSA